MNETALAVFCRRVHPGLVSALALQCGSKEVAEELAQETLVRVWERWDRVLTVDSPEAWTFRVGFNLASSWWRRQQAERRARQRVEVSPPEGAADPSEGLAVRAALLQLPPRQRTALIMRYFLDMTVEATAATMACAPGTVKALSSQGIDGLRRHLSEPAVAEERTRA